MFRWPPNLVGGATARRTDKTSCTITKGSAGTAVGMWCAAAREIRLECGEKLNGALCVDTYRRAGSLRRSSVIIKFVLCPDVKCA